MPRNTKISGRNRTKNFRELFEEIRNNVMMTSIKKLKMEANMEKQGKA